MRYAIFAKKIWNYVCQNDRYIYVHGISLIHVLVIGQMISTPFVQYRLSRNGSFSYNETFAIYAQDIQDYEYFKIIFEYFSDFEKYAPGFQSRFYGPHCTTHSELLVGACRVLQLPIQTLQMSLNLMMPSN